MKRTYSGRQDNNENDSQSKTKKPSQNTAVEGKILSSNSRADLRSARIHARSPRWIDGEKQNMLDLCWIDALHLRQAISRIILGPWKVWSGGFGYCVWFESRFWWPFHSFFLFLWFLGQLNQKKKQEKEQEISSLVNKGVLRRVNHESGELITLIFLRSKSDGGHRMILNLKRLNTNAENWYFKMLRTLITVCLSTKKHEKYFAFQYNALYQYLVLPNGFSLGSRKFTKLL